MQANYDAVVVDEVQDLTESVLDLILKSLKDENKSNFLLCGDANQVIHPSFFSKSRLKSFLGQNGYVKNNESEIFYTLDKNYRNSEQVIELANRILHLKNYCFASEDKLTANEREAFFMTNDTKNTGNVSFFAKDKEQEMAKKVSESINWAILVLDDENKQDARKLFGTPLVFNIHEAKGLEFENVILYKFTSDKAYNKILSVACPNKDEKEIENTISEVRSSYNEKDVNTSRNKDKEDKSFEEYKFYMNALYVGVTRAIDNVYIIDDEKKCNLLQVIKPEGEKIINIEDIKKEESSPEEWRDMALNLIDEGNIEQAKNIALNLIEKENMEQAKNIAEKLLRKGEEEHFREVMFSLKALASDEMSLIKQFKTMDISNVVVLFNQMLEGHKRKNLLSFYKKALRPFVTLLQKKDKKNPISSLHCAVAKGFYNLVEFLLQEGINVNVRGHNGCTPLHIAAGQGNGNMVKLLLDKGADVNAKDNGGNTPLYFALSSHEKSKCLYVIELLLQKGADVNARGEKNFTPLELALQIANNSRITECLLASPNVNVGCVELQSFKKSKNQKIFLQKKDQDEKLFKKVKEATEEEGKGKLGTLLKEIKDLLKPKSKYGFKPSLNYSPDGDDKNTTLKIAIKAGGKLLQLLYDYAKKNIGVDSEIFKRLKYAKENPQPRSSFNDVTTPHNLAQAQVSTT
ncbi:ankyrin repeat domain-containing protein [Wolbachia endosymbiont (group A) of Lypha dubia]|uniref:ankyrin repeat domain-containing protein n=1 Tax=Wolbachia endosymbiont (group A) of Lypha dubia TaxID=3066146 RepID=UPI0033417DA3